MVPDEIFVCLLLAAGADLNHADDYTWTALHCAASKLRVGIMEGLTERSIDVWHRNAAGMTALDVAWRAVCDKTIYVNWETGELEKWNRGVGKCVGPYDYTFRTDSDSDEEDSEGQTEQSFEFEVVDGGIRRLDQVDEEEDDDSQNEGGTTAHDDGDWPKIEEDFRGREKMTT